MTLLVETIARVAKKEGDLELSEALKEVAEKRKGVSRETLDGVILYERDSPVERISEHSNFDHDRLENSVVFKKGPREGQKIHITRVDSKLLTHFETHRGEPLSAESIKSTVFEGKCELGNVRQRVHHLRKYLEEDTKHPKIIVTENGGYMFIDVGSKDKPSEPGHKDIGERIFELSGLKFYPDKRKIIVKGVEVELGPKERTYLELMFLNDVATYKMFEDIEIEQYGVYYKGNVRNVATNVVERLRRKTEPDKRVDFQLILLVPGVGYRLRHKGKLEELDTVTVFEKRF